MDYKVIYTEDLPEGIGGTAFPPFPWLFGIGTITIKLRTKYSPENRNDLGILNHEIVHVKQYKQKWNHSIMYLLSKNYRYKCELEAYTEQIKAYNYNSTTQVNWIVEALSEKYRLNFSKEKITRDLDNIIKNINN